MTDDNYNLVPPHLICGKELSVISENDVINMPDNVNEFKLNDILSNNDPDRCNFHSCNSSRYYTSIELKKQLAHFNNFSLFHTNIRSSNQNLNQLKCYLNLLDINFSIIGLSETWGKPQHIDMQTIPGYIHYYCTRAKNKRGGGTSLYIKSSIPFKSRSDLEFKKTLFESSIIEIDKHIFHTRRNIIVGIFYRSPNSSLKVFNESLEKLLNEIEKEKSMPILWAILMLTQSVNLQVLHPLHNNFPMYFCHIIIRN